MFMGKSLSGEEPMDRAEALEETWMLKSFSKLSVERMVKVSKSLTSQPR